MFDFWASAKTAATWFRSLVVGPSSGMFVAGDEAAALAVREVRGFEAAAAPLAEEPATLPGIVVVGGPSHA